MSTHITRILLVFIGIIQVSAVLAQSEPDMMVKREAGQPLSEPIPHNLCQPDGIAIGGYDVVSYRQDDGPQIGTKEVAALYNGLNYLFVNKLNRTAFLEEPDRYLPEYNGFCAITLALGRVTCPQYKNYKIEDDRLLLFEVSGFTNGRTLWNSNPVDFRDQADGNFSQIAD